jgi:hypothetical protein
MPTSRAILTAMTPDILRARLRELVTEAIGVDTQLEQVIALSTPTRSDGRKRGRIDHSQPPWNAPVAHLVTDLHAEARAMEATLRRGLDIPDKRRGPSSENTARALEAVANLAESSRQPLVAECVNWLNRWVGRARVVLGERDQPQRLPRSPGLPEPRCPYCERMTLRHLASRGEVRCINPECKTGEGRRPVARMEWSVVAVEWVLAWNDGYVGIPA